MANNELLSIVKNAAEDKKAENIVILNVEGLSSIADYFVICHANSEKQVQAIAREIKKSTEEADIHIERLEGFNEAKWVLIDIGDIVVHVFHRDERDYYNLERLWGDAPVAKLPNELS